MILGYGNILPYRRGTAKRSNTSNFHHQGYDDVQP